MAGTGNRTPPDFAAFLEKTLGVAAGAVLFLLMTVTFVDVVGRYLFNAPLFAGYELVQFGMGALVFLILPVVTAREENVCVELIPIERGRRVGAGFAAASALVSVVVLAGFGIELWARAETFRAAAETSSNLRIPLAPFAYFMSVVWFACAAIALALAVLRHRSHRPDDIA